MPIPRPVAGMAGARGRAASGRNREALSTDAACAGGPARSSGEAPVMGAERRGRLICGLFARATRRCSGRRRVGKSGPEGKSFQIPKQLVWEAYRQVKANKGAAGVDGQSIGDFEDDLRNNLYKIWNRMSSGTYFPPPVRAVEIPKRTAGAREFSGFPLSRTGSRRRWSRWGWDPARSRSFIRTPTGTGRGRARWTRWRNAVSGAGRRTG